MFTFSPLLGAQSGAPASQALLELDGGVKILVDVGWDASFDVSRLQSLEQHVGTLSIVLLTHATVEHIGAFAHCCKHVPGFNRVPVYATTPVVNLGRTLITDLYACAPLAASVIPSERIASSAAEASAPALLLQPPTPDEIGVYFSRIHPLKFSQPHQPIPSPFSPALGGLTITAYSAGHTLGGTIWHIQHGLESIVYAADWHQGRENLLGGANWLASGDEVIEPLRRPTALVCSSRGVERTKVPPTKQRDDMLISLIRETIARGGKVLIPTDSSARVLELAFLLNSTWRENVDGPHADTYKNTRIYMASKSSGATVRYLQSMLEWMDDSVTREVEAAMSKGQLQGNTGNPLEWDFVKQIEKMSQVEKVLRRRRPCVFLASDSSFEWGFSRQALQSLASNPENLVILPEAISQLENVRTSLGRQLWDFYNSNEGQQSAQSGAKVVNADGLTLDVLEPATEPLNADETALFNQYFARQQQLHSTLQGDNMLTETTTAEIGDDQASESDESEDEDEDAEHQGRALNLSAQLTQSKRKTGLTDAELGVNVLLRGKNVHDYDVRNKRGRERMFPFVARRSRNDEFGDLIKPEDYLRAEERDDVDGVDTRDGAKPLAAVGQKRKWDDAAASAPKARRDSVKQNKHAKIEADKRGHDAIDDHIARITGVVAGAGGTDTEAVNGELEEDSASDDGDESDYEPEEVSSTEPQKMVFSTRSLSLQLRIAHVDFAGLAPLRDIINILSFARPRKLILTCGSVSETETLARELRGAQDLHEAEVFTPGVGDTIDASVDTNAWTLKLGRELVRNLFWQPTSKPGLSIAAVKGRIAIEAVELKDEEEEEGEGGISRKKKKQKLIANIETGSERPETPLLPVLELPLSHTIASQSSAAQPIRVGDLRINDIRARLSARGHNVALRGQGTLLVDGSVVIRKAQNSGLLEVECGSWGLRRPDADFRGRGTSRGQGGSGTFYDIRQAVYETLAIVSRG